MVQKTKHQFGIVRIGQSLIGIPMAHLSEVFRAENEQELPQKGDLLETGIELRGRPVPIVKISALARLETSELKPMFGVILEHSKRLLGFFVDDVIGFVTVANGDIHPIEKASSEGPSIFKTLFRHQDKFVSILDVALLFSVPEVFTSEQPAATAKTAMRVSEPVLTFEAGNAFYSVAAVEVYAAIPKQQINKTAIAVGACLGEITYHGRRIPVVCPVSILGLGTALPQTVTEVVALRFPGDLVLGFAVDAIHKIGTAPAGMDTPVPIWLGARSFIKKVVVHDDAPEIYAIDLDTLFAAQDLQDIASLSKIEEPEEQTIDRTSLGAENIVREKNRYLVVDAADRLAIPLSQINRIVPLPERLTTTHASQRGFKGYFTLSDESIALFDLSECTGRHTINADSAKILLTGKTGHQIGFLVEQVVGIEISEWHEKLRDDDAKQNAKLVQLGNAENAVILPAFDLADAIPSNNRVLADAACG